MAGALAPKAFQVFAGCAKLSRELRRQGFDAVGVDVPNSRAGATAPVLKVVLESMDGQLAFFRLLETSDVVYVHISPPCSTGSMAFREAKLGGGQARSDDHP